MVFYELADHGLSCSQPFSQIRQEELKLNIAISHPAIFPTPTILKNTGTSISDYLGNRGTHWSRYLYRKPRLRIKDDC